MPYIAAEWLSVVLTGDLLFLYPVPSTAAPTRTVSSDTLKVVPQYKKGQIRRQCVSREDEKATSCQDTGTGPAQGYRLAEQVCNSNEGKRDHQMLLLSLLHSCAYESQSGWAACTAASLLTSQQLTLSPLEVQANQEKAPQERINSGRHDAHTLTNTISTQDPWLVASQRLQLGIRKWRTT
eukprot:1157497-Pelagomonas_calceolata.AAC.1